VVVVDVDAQVEVADDNLDYLAVLDSEQPESSYTGQEVAAVVAEQGGHVCHAFQDS